MKSDTQSITIEIAKDELFNFISNPENMAKWAPSLCSEARKDGNTWVLSTKMGDVKLTSNINQEFGIVDFYLAPALPIKIAIYTRMVPNGSSSEFMLTHFQIPFTPESAFEKQKDKIREGLTALKRILESRD